MNGKDYSWNLKPDEKDSGYRIWHKNRNWQHGLFHRAMAYCKEFRTALDIGAGYGAATRIFAKNFEEVYAIEMLSDLMPYLKDNTKEFNNIYYHNTAVGKKPGVRNYYYYPTYSGRSGKNSQQGNETGGPGWVEKEIVLELDTITLPDFRRFETWRSAKAKYPTVVDLLKMDVEGGEFAIIQGCGDFFDQFIPVICVERADSEPIIERLHSQLQKLGYVLVELWRNDEIFIHKNRLDTMGSLRRDLKNRRVFYNEW